MKGSTVDAMSDAVDNAEVMLFCVSLAYKESANCRLECSYGHQQEVSMIPLMMEEGYRPPGWLGLLLGTRGWYPFHREAVETDAGFLQQIDAVAREIGDRGKPKVVSEGVPPTPAPAPGTDLSKSTR